MKKISVKLSVRDYKYLCVLMRDNIKELRGCENEIAYSYLWAMEDELRKMTNKVISHKSKSITLSMGAANMYIFLTSIGMRIQLYDDANKILIEDLVKKLRKGISKVRSEEMALQQVMI